MLYIVLNALFGIVYLLISNNIKTSLFYFHTKREKNEFVILRKLTKSK